MSKGMRVIIVLITGLTLIGIGRALSEESIGPVWRSVFAIIGLIGIGLYFYGFYLWAKLKGRHGAHMLWGLLGLIGVIILACMEDRSREVWRKRMKQMDSGLSVSPLEGKEQKPPRNVRRRWTMRRTLIIIGLAALLAGSCFGSWQWGNHTGYNTAYTLAYATGFDKGHAEGYKKGSEWISPQVYSQGYWKGHQDGYNAGYEKGAKDGHASGYREGYVAGDQAGYNRGYEQGKQEGYNRGYKEGKQDAPIIRVPIPLYRESGVIESCIDGDFEGWEGDTIFKLENGQIWQQTSYSYTYHYAYRPEVIIYPTGGKYKMVVVGVSETIYVERLK